jgi:hypothetical protein
MSYEAAEGFTQIIIAWGYITAAMLIAHGYSKHKEGR